MLSACGTTATLKDGTYTHRQTYKAGEYSIYIDVNASLKDQKITDISVVPDPNGQAAIQYAQEFKNGLQAKIIGKTLNSAKKKGYVSGASLTSKAFADALDAIQKEAQ
jgi:uncharacterized protein with FMN-binding domain